MHPEIHIFQRQYVVVTGNNVFRVVSVFSINTVYSVLVGIQCWQNVIKSSVAISNSLSRLVLVVICVAQIVPEQ